MRFTLIIFILFFRVASFCQSKYQYLFDKDSLYSCSQIVTYRVLENDTSILSILSFDKEGRIDSIIDPKYGSKTSVSYLKNSIKVDTYQHGNKILNFTIKSKKNETKVVEIDGSTIQLIFNSTGKIVKHVENDEIIAEFIYENNKLIESIYLNRSSLTSILSFENLEIEANRMNTSDSEIKRYEIKLPIMESENQFIRYVLFLKEEKVISTEVYLIENNEIGLTKIFFFDNSQKKFKLLSFELLIK